VAFVSALLFGLFVIAQDASAQSSAAGSSENIRSLGQRMYREGVLASGESMQSIIKGDVVVQGTAFTCVSCHMSSGLGSIEGGVITTPTNGRSLYSPRMQPSGIRSNMGGGMGQSKNQLQPPPPPGRPAYTDELIASVLRGGVDPSGRVLDPVMPRYKLNDHDMTTLVTYLKSLSSEESPGVDSQTLRFATIISEDVPSEIRFEQANLLDKQFSSLNEQSRNFEKRLKDPKLKRHLSNTGRLLYRNLSLSRWLLKGPPETWRAQLEEYYKKEPVFAFLGGIVAGDWKPVNDFSEEHQIPSLFPQTDFPVVSENNSYTMYLSKGYFQEGEGAARFLNRNDEFVGNRSVIQIVRESPEGKALASGFESTWREIGHQSPVTLRLQKDETVNSAVIEALIAKNGPATVLVWDGTGALKVLESLAEMTIKPSKVIVSSRYIGKLARTIPENIRTIAYLTYPYRLPHDEVQLEEYFLGKSFKDTSEKDRSDKTLKQTFILTRVLIQALTEMKDNFYRDYFLDVLSMIKDMEMPLYERLSFGPGQRYASKGCYVVQLSKGENPTYIKRSEWVTH
jgi:hypothetical protein